jgi:hypothetical protein
VLHGSDGPEGPGRPAGLLLQLPAGRRHWALSGLEVAAGEFPEPLEETGVLALLHEPPSIEFEHHHRRLMMGAGGPGPPSRDRPGVREGGEGPAPVAHGALGAPGGAREADRLPELHHGLVERPRPIIRECRRERRLELPTHRSTSHVPGLRGPSRRDPQSVGVHRQDRGPEGEARHRPGDVRSDPGQLLPRRGRPGEPPAPRTGDLPRRFPKVPGPGVVSRAFPYFQDRFQGSLRQVRHRRERPHEPLEVRERLGHPGLLQEDLGDPHAVRVPVPPPRQGAGGAIEPRDEGEPPGGRGGGSFGRAGPRHAGAMPGKR